MITKGKKILKANHGGTATGAIIGVLVTLMIVMAVAIVFLFFKMNGNNTQVVVETVNKETVAATKEAIEKETETASKTVLHEIAESTQAVTTTQAAVSGNSGTMNNTTINNYYMSGQVYGPYSYGNFLVDYDYYNLDADSYFILPDSDTRYITDYDISWLVSLGADSNGRTYVQQAINELYARHNSVFKKTAVQDYFRTYYSRMGWNTGSPFGSYAQDEVLNWFNSCEKANYKKLLKVR